MENQRYQPGGKPPSNLGGWRGSPASLAALAAHRPTWKDARRCRCGQPARRGHPGCWMHSKLSDAEASAPRLARRMVDRMVRAGLVAPELQGMDIWRRTRLAPLALAPYALALAVAWSNRDTDPAAWSVAVRRARQAVEA